MPSIETEGHPHLTASAQDDAEAATLFAEYPNRDASNTNTDVTVSDGVYLGQKNDAAIKRIAQTARPDAL